jgi:hypothetical protein
MAAKDISVKRYIVRLNVEEREHYTNNWSPFARRSPITAVLDKDPNAERQFNPFFRGLF